MPAQRIGSWRDTSCRPRNPGARRPTRTLERPCASRGPSCRPVPPGCKVVGVVTREGRTWCRFERGGDPSRDESAPPTPLPWRSICSGWSTSTRSSRSSGGWSTTWASAGDGGGSLVLCEHPPTISVGRSGSRAHILLDDEELRGRGVAVRWVNRGGGCVLHLPGQLVGYLALPLAASGLDVRALSRRAAPGPGRRPRRVRPGGLDPPGPPGRLPGECPGGVGRRGGEPLDRLSWVHAERLDVPGAVRGARRAAASRAARRSARRRWSRVASAPPRWRRSARR